MRARSTAWHDAARPDTMTRYVVAPVDELPPGTRKFLTIDERPIAVFNIKGEFFGLLNRCPHQGAALCEGPLIGLAQSSDPGEIEYTKLGEIIRCPWHGWEFDIRTGQSYCDPGCVKTCLSQGCSELFSQFPSLDRTGKCNWFSHRQNREGISTRKLNVRVFTQPCMRTFVSSVTATLCPSLFEVRYS